MSDFVLSPAERSFLQALENRAVRFLVVGMAAAILEGTPGTTLDLDLWFGAFPDEDKLKEAAREAGGFYLAGIGHMAPTLGGEGLRRVDLVLSAQGLSSFDDEYAQARSYDLDGLRLQVLPLPRVAHSKRTANRPKDRAQLPAIEATLAARSVKGAREKPTPDR